MSHAENYAPPKDSNESPFSQLSADAACFIPSCLSPVLSAAPLSEAPPYFSSYVWPGAEVLDPTFYVRNLERWPMNQVRQTPTVPLSFQRPSSLKTNYWPIAYPENGRSRSNPDSDGFYSSAAVSWNDPALQQTCIPVASPFPQRAAFQDVGHNHSGIVTSATSTVNGSNSAVCGAEGVVIRAKKKKKKHKTNAKVKTLPEDSNLPVVLDVKTEKSFGNEDQHIKAVVRDGLEIAARKQYRENSSQTDFSKELSRLSLSEKPNTLYGLPLISALLQEYSASIPVAAKVDADSIRAPNPQVLDYRMALMSNSSPALDPEGPRIAVAPKSGASLVQRSSKKIIEGVKKSSFDHSSIRSQSGRRKSTGISTSDHTKGKDFSQEQRKMKIKNPGNRSKNDVVKCATDGTVVKVKHERFAKRKQSSEPAFESSNSSSSVLRQKSFDDGTDDGKGGVFIDAGKGEVKDPLVRKKLLQEKSRSSSQQNQRVRSVSSGVRASEMTSRSVSRVQKISNSGATHHQPPKSQQPHRTGNQDRGSSKNRLPDSDILPPGSAKKKRQRHKQKKKSQAKADKPGDDVEPEANDVILGLAEMSVVPNLDDSEFPNLTSSRDSKGDVSSGPIKYSDILSGRAKMPSFRRFAYTTQTVNSIVKDEDTDDASDLDDRLPLKPGLMMSNTTATRSLSQPPRSPPKQSEEKKAVGAGKKTQEPITLSIFDMITVKTKNKKATKELDKNVIKSVGMKPTKIQGSKTGNLLDSSAVHSRRGKEREVPKLKKPSLLRKVILKERESRRQKFLRDCMAGSEEESSVDAALVDGDTCDDSTGSQQRRHFSAPGRQCQAASISPCAARNGSVLSTDGSIDTEVSDGQKKLLQSLIHSCRFREYCTQVLSRDINSCCAALLAELVRFQDRLFHKDPVKAKLKRRICLGLREVAKHLKGGKIKCVIISPNLERIQSKGGLDEALHNIIGLCQMQIVPFVFALSRKQLGRACCKVVPVSVVGIFSYAGAEEHFSRLKNLTEKARESYEEMVSNMKAELEEANQPTPLAPVETNGDFTGQVNECEMSSSFDFRVKSPSFDNHGESDHENVGVKNFTTPDCIISPALRDNIDQSQEPTNSRFIDSDLDCLSVTAIEIDLSSMT